MSGTIFNFHLVATMRRNSQKVLINSINSRFKWIINQILPNLLLLSLISTPDHYFFLVYLSIKFLFLSKIYYMNYKKKNFIHKYK